MNNPIRQTLADGRASVGSWLNLGSPLAAEVMAAVGFEWLVVDAEHTAYDLTLVAHTFRAIEARGSIPLVRAWDHEPATIGRLLDAGAYGIVFPHVSTPEQARALADGMRYPPVGTRSKGTGRCETISADYRHRSNEELLCIPQIEDMEGIENAEAIASVSGVDIGFLGPNDLSLSMGVEAGAPEHEAALLQFLEGCQRAGKPCGLPAKDGHAARLRIEQGFRFVDVGSDFRMLEAAAAQALADVTGA